MLFFKRFLFLLVFFALNIGCKSDTEIPEGVALTLKNSGGNRSELLKVINHYKAGNNDLKLKAAYFLIENMFDQYHYTGQGVIKYRTVFSKMDSLLKSGNGIFNRSWDSIQALAPLPDLSTVRAVQDAKVIKAHFLINHIESAFKAWHYPWAKSLNFEDFCEYILPYKLANEEPEANMKRIQSRYQWVFDSMKTSSSPILACNLVNRELARWFYINARFECNWDLSYNDLLNLHTGKCIHATQLAACTMRALGIPIIMDFTPHWANKNFSHGWNALLYQNKTIPFVGSESNAGQTKIEFSRSYWIRRKRAKIFRRMYSIQKNTLANQIGDVEEIPVIFRTRHIKDVTAEYVPVSDVKIQVNAREGDDFAYLCVFNNQKWQPVFWSKVSMLRNAEFKDMEMGIVYLPAHYNKNKILPAGQPFILTANGEIVQIDPDLKKTEKVVIKAKYPEDPSNSIFSNETYELFYWKDDWKSLGQKKAESDSLVYTNAPTGALLMVKDVAKGAQERIFMFKNGVQQWW